MITFDAAERNICVVKRQSTSTPLQALALLNDVQMVEAAKMFGQRMFEQPGTLSERLAWGFRLALARTAREQELQILMQLWQEQHNSFQKDPEAARKLLAVGDSKPKPDNPEVDLAAYTITALAILNHDGVVHRR